jgi:integrase
MSGKRTNGEGTIYKRGNRWRAQFTLPTGERKSVSGGTAKEVQKQLDALKREVAAGMHSTRDADMTLHQWLAKWIESERHHLEVTTEDNYRSLIRLHFDGIGDISLSKITPAMIQDHYAGKLRTYSSTYVNHIHGVLNSALESAVNLEILIRNPAVRVKAPPKKPKKFEPLSEEQAQELVRVVRGHRFETEIVLALTTGAREAELLGMRWQDVFWARSSVRINTTLKRLHGEYFMKVPKSDTSSRTIPIGEYAMALLARQKEKQHEAKELAGEAWADSWNLIFTKGDGSPIHRSVLTKTFQKLMEAHGLPRVRFHDLRHTFATLMLERGVDIKTVSEYLGHSSVEITLRVYGHVTARMRGGLVDEINALIPIQRVIDAPTSDGDA